MPEPIEEAVVRPPRKRLICTVWSVTGVAAAAEISASQGNFPHSDAREIYDWLDNGRRPSARRVVPALQHPPLGTIFPALPGVTEGFTLLAIEPERTLTLGWLAPDGTPEVTWTFVLDEVTPGVTRLLVRVRGGPGYRFHGLPLALTRVVIRVVHFIMQRKQLLGIASRAETYARPDPIDAAVPVLTYFALAFGISWGSGLFVLGPSQIPTTAAGGRSRGPPPVSRWLERSSNPGLPGTKP